MTYYITSGLTEKSLLARFYTETPLNRNNRWHELERTAEKLEQQLYELRTITEFRYGKTHTYLCALSGDKLEAVRNIRKQLASIGIE